MKDKKRMLHYDLLRILAAFSVVMLHSAAQCWYDMDVYSTDWVIANSYDAVFRFGVPIFVMISGALFLDREYELSIKRLYLHNIFRIMILYAVWCCIYGLYDCRNFSFEAVGIREVLREMLSGRYHLWFLPMIAGIYALLPVLRSWVHHAERRNIEYFLGLFVVLQICSETLRAFTVTDELHEILDLLKIELACGYVGYFVLGYYLVHVGLRPRIRKFIYILFVPCILLNILFGNVLAWRAGTPVGDVYDSFGLFTFVIVLAIFLFATEKGSAWEFGPRSTKIIRGLSADTLGAYVMHVGLMEILQLYGIDCMVLPNIVGIPLLAIMCYVICLLLAAMLRRIPVIGRYLC